MKTTYLTKLMTVYWLSMLLLTSCSDWLDIQPQQEIKAKHPEKPIVGVFMTTSEFFAKLSDMQVNVPFFMYAEQAADGLNRLNQQRI